MNYKKFLKTLKVCPFCCGIESRVLIENDSAMLTYSQAPYHKYHLLVVPKRHIKSIKDLTWDENVCIMALIVSGVKTLSKIGHDDCTILSRDGDALGKSVSSHLHYHIIPGGVIKDISLKKKVLKMLSDDEEKVLKEELRKITEYRP